MKKLSMFLTASILVLASTRGALVYHFGTQPNLTYSISAAALVLLGLYATWRMMQFKIHPDLGAVKKAFQINIMLIGGYSIFFMMFSFTSSVAIVYTFLIFPIVFILMKWTRKELETVLHIIFVITASGIFIMQHIALNDFQELYRIQSMLRPLEDAIPNIGGIAQIGGYQASNHDAANILVMICTYYFVRLFTSDGMSRLLLVGLFTFGIVALLLTASASNITVFFGMLLLAALLMPKGVERKLVSAMLFGLCVLVIIAVDNHYFEVLHFMTKFRSQSELEGGGMFNSLNLNALYYSLPSFFIGLGYQLKVPMIHSEIAFVKIFVSYGIIPSLVLFYILFLPLNLLRRVSKTARRLRFFVRQGHQNISINEVYQDRQRLVFLAAPILTGTMTLLHYGSLLRVTSVGLFCLLIAIFLKDYLAFMVKHTLAAASALQNSRDSAGATATAQVGNYPIYNKPIGRSHLGFIAMCCFRNI